MGMIVCHCLQTCFCSTEYRYMKENIALAKIFNFVTRYIDDLLTLKNSQFVVEIRHIYPTEQELNRGFYYCTCEYITL